MNPPEIPTVPEGPFDARPSGFVEFDVQAQVMRQALAGAGVELGEYDRAIVDWLSHWDWATVAVISSWVARANGGTS